MIAIDTWLGSVENWTNPQERPGIKLTHGYPQLYFTFAANVISERLQDYVLPLPLDSVNARQLISRSGIVADMIHVDGGHDYQSVTTDLTQWWPVLRSGGLYVGDDYHPYWVEVVKATDDFFKANPPVLLDDVGRLGVEVDGGVGRVLEDQAIEQTRPWETWKVGCALGSLGERGGAGFALRQQRGDGLADVEGVGVQLAEF